MTEKKDILKGKKIDEEMLEQVSGGAVAVGENNGKVIKRVEDFDKNTGGQSKITRGDLYPK